MRKKGMTHAQFLIGAILIAFPSFAFAAEGGGDMRLTILRIFQIIWIVAAVAGLGILIYGFVRLRASHDDLFATEGAKKFVVIGVIVFLGSALISIVLFFVSRFFENRIKEIAPPSSVIDDQTFQGLSGELSGQHSKVAEHSPKRDAKNVPRDTAIQIKFKTPVKAESIMDEKRELNSASVKIQESASVGKPNPTLVKGAVAFDPTRTIVTIRPATLLGAPDVKTSYTITLTSQILKENDESIFGNTGNYRWQFEVSGIVDNTPPFVENVLPVVSLGEKVPKNALLQITFSEAIDASTLSNDIFSIVEFPSKKNIPGSFMSGNNFKTFTFVPSDSCGKNSCGDPVSCLPKDIQIQFRVRAASLPEQKKGDAPYKARFPYDGVVDLSGNAFDGGGEGARLKNGKAEGSPFDDYVTTFITSNQMDVTPPSIFFHTPNRNSGSVPSQAPVEITFSKFMDATSLHQSSIFLSNDVNYWIESRHDLKLKRTVAKIEHDELKTQTIYTPEVRSDARDAFQNCYKPCIGVAP